MLDLEEIFCIFHCFLRWTSIWELAFWHIWYPKILFQPFRLFIVLLISKKLSSRTSILLIKKIAHFGIITPNLMNSIFTRVKWIQIIPQWYLNFERLTHSVPNFEMEIFNLMQDIFWRTFRPKTLLTFDKYRYVLKIGWFRA